MPNPNSVFARLRRQPRWRFVAVLVLAGFAYVYFHRAGPVASNGVTFWSPIVAFSISALVGIIFGIYPAFRAARMDPVEALRHE